MSNEFDSLPEEVKVAARELLAISVLRARKRHPPGDGGMLIIGDACVGEGAYSGGYSLQANFLEDSRFLPGPTVRVYVYRNSPASDAWLESPVEYTEQDLLALDRRLLANLRDRHDALRDRIREVEERVVWRSGALQ